MKRLVVCCDGTWNDPDKSEDGVPLATNVVKVAEAVRVGRGRIEQRLYYDSGVGTAGSLAQRIFDGATGTGLSRRLVQAYRFLVLNYEPGDELYFFGFSRGAFTVRSLGGLVVSCGILRRDDPELIRRGFALYKARRKSSHPRGREATLFRRAHSVLEVVPIRFVGVWDTVGALGNPLNFSSPLSRLNRFHDLKLSSTVEFAYQALAIDETRGHFRAALWEQQPHAADQVLEQMWFAGAHSDVGGGYPSTGLSDEALEWMRSKAVACGLDLPAPAMNPDPLAPITESRSGGYRLWRPWHRPICDPAPGTTTNEGVHPSALSRFDIVGDYRPPNLVAHLRRERDRGVPLPAATLRKVT